MSPETVLAGRPRLYRTLLRALPVGVALTVLAVVLGTFALTRTINRNTDLAHQAQVQNVRQASTDRQLLAQAEQQKRVIALLALETSRQQATIRLLCNRGVILDGLIQSIVALFPADGHLPTGAAKFLAELQTYHLDLVEQQTNPGSPCVKP